MKNKQLIEKMTALETRMAELEKTKRRRLILWLAAIILAPIGVFASTLIPNSFTDGETLSAAKLNANFQALAAKIDAMEGKSWRLIYETDVASATTFLDISGLNGNTDYTYMIISRIRGGNGAADYKVQLNGDTGTNYGFQRNMGTNGGFDSSRDTGQTGLYLAGVNATSQVTTSHGILYALAGYERLFLNSFGGSATGTTVNGTGHYTSVWNNTGANIVTMRLISSTANGIGAGSHIEIWARR